MTAQFPQPVPTDNEAWRLPISIKGVVFSEGQVILLKNERNEWELPGGKLEPGETPQECLAREIAEELGLAVTVGPILDCWVYEITPHVSVYISTYLCQLEDNIVTIRISNEHKECRLFAVAEVDPLPIPDGYIRSIKSALKQR